MMYGNSKVPTIPPLSLRERGGEGDLMRPVLRSIPSPSIPLPEGEGGFSLTLDPSPEGRGKQPC